MSESIHEDAEGHWTIVFDLEGLIEVSRVNWMLSRYPFKNIDQPVRNPSGLLEAFLKQ